MPEEKGFRRLFRSQHGHRHRRTRLVVKNSYFCVKGCMYEIGGRIDMTGLKGTLKAKITSPVGAVSEMEMETAEDGAFSVTFLADVEGIYQVFVEFLGEGAYQPSNATIEVAVKPVPIPTNISLVGPEGDVIVGMTVEVKGNLSF